jgi:hypothetical protein
VRLGFVFMILAMTVPAGNLVANAGFEEVRDGKPVQWTLGAISDGGRATFSANSEAPKSGKHCGRLRGDAEWAAVSSGRIAIRPGKRYELRAFVRTAKGEGYVKIDYFRGDTYLGMTSDEYVKKNAWTELRFSSETENHPTATHVVATLIGGGEGEFDVSFDDVSIVEK